MADELNPVGWFEIPVNNMDASKAFYEHMLGIELDLQDMDGLPMAWFPMVDGAYGATGSLVQHETHKPSAEGTLIYFSVGDIAAALSRAAEKGGSTSTEKMSIGEHGFIGVANDPDGNRVGLHSMQ